MAETPTAGQRLEIRTGAPVVGADGEIGRVARVVVSPGSGDVTGLVVRKGLLLRRDIVIPVEAIAEANEDIVRVRLTTDQLNHLPEYRDEDFIGPPDDWQSSRGQGLEGVLFRRSRLLTRKDFPLEQAVQTAATAGGKPIRAGRRVVCRDGEVGPLDLILLDPTTRRAMYFVVRGGGLFRRDTIIPVEWVRHITDDRVLLDVGREQLEQLPEYRPDAEITADVLDALVYHPELGPEDIRNVAVQTQDGMVELRGMTRTARARDVIVTTIRGVRGVLGVLDDLQTLEALAAAVHEGRYGRSTQPPAYGGKE